MVNRDPRDGNLRLSQADNFNQRVLWYVVDDSITEISGSTSADDMLRFYPRDNKPERMVGAILAASNDTDPMTGTYTTLHTISAEPPEGWNEVTLDLGSYRHYRLAMPNGSYGNIAELELYRGGDELITGTTFGTPGSWEGGPTAFDKAFDGNVETFFDAASADGNVIGITPGAAEIPGKVNSSVLNVGNLEVGGQ